MYQQVNKNKNWLSCDHEYISTLLSTGCVIFFIIGIFSFSTQAFQAAGEGIHLWFYTVFPALLPFLIGTNLLIGLGVVDFLGTLLEPIMRPVFNVPGVGAFAFIMGMTSGYPIGAKITADLREKNEITQVEAQRLMSFTNNSGPLFMLGAVAIGMLHSAPIGFFIMATHYLSSITIGFLFRFYKAFPQKKEKKVILKNNIIKRAFNNQLKARKKDGRKIGALLGESVMNAMDIIVQIGGFIILFSVLVTLLESAEFLKWGELILEPFVRSIGFDQSLQKGWLFGLLEVTNGAKLISSSASPMIQKTTIIASLIAWGGFSIHAQTASIVSKTDIKISVYLVCKLLQSILAFWYGFLLYPFVEAHLTWAVPAITITNRSVWQSIIHSSWGFVTMIICLLIGALIIGGICGNKKRDVF